MAKYTIDTIFNQFQKGFNCQTHRREAMKNLNSLYHKQRSLIMDALLINKQEINSINYESWNNLYWSIPHNLHQWKPKHHLSLIIVDLGCDEYIKTINELKDLRDAIKDTEILPVITNDSKIKIKQIEKSIEEYIKSKQQQFISGLSLAHIFNGLNVSVNSHYVTNQHNNTFIRCFYYLNGKMTALQMIIAIAEQYAEDIK